MRILKIEEQNYSNGNIEIALDYRAHENDMYTPGAIIADRTIAEFVNVEIAIHTDGRVTVRSTSIAPSDRTYYHVFIGSNGDPVVNPKFCDATEEQKNAIAKLWARQIPDLKTHVTGSRLDGYVGRTLCLYVPDLRERVEKFTGTSPVVA